MTYSSKIRRGRGRGRSLVKGALGLVSLDALHWQERHSPTETIEVRITSERSKVQTRRRKQDARLYDGLTSHQIKAMENIDAGFRALTQGGGMSKMRFEARIPAGDSPAPGQRHDWLERTYMEWHRQTQIEGGINGAAVLDIVVFGKGTGAVDKLRKKRKGWARENLIEEGLKLYCKICGWPAG